jgi:hypothetical protein
LGIRRGRERERERERERGSDEEEDEGFDPMNRAARHGSEPECVGQVGAGSEPSRVVWLGQTPGSDLVVPGRR